MKRRSRLEVVLAGLAIVASIGGVAAAGGVATGATGQKIKTITFANPLPSYAGWLTSQQCLEKEAKHLGIAATAVGPSGANVDDSLSINEIEQAIATKRSAIVLAPLDASFQPVINQARAAGIYVGSIDTLGSGKNLNVQAGTNLESIGVQVAQQIGQLKPTATIATLSENAAGDQHAEILGIESVIKTKYPHMTLVTNVYDNGNTTSDVDLVDGLLTAHPTLQYIFSANGASVGAVITAIKERGLTGKVRVIVNDLTPQSAAEIKSGTVYGVNDQHWCQMGTEVVDKLVAVSQGKLSSNTTNTFPTPLNFVTKKNLAYALAHPS